MRQIDPGGKDLAAFVFRVIDHVAAQDADLAHRIEDRDIGRRFGVVERVVILGVEKARIFHGHNGRLALPLDTGRTKVDHAMS